VKITSDGNLACKLEALSGQAEAKLKEIAELERQQNQNCPKSILQPDKRCVLRKFPPRSSDPSAFTTPPLFRRCPWVKKQ
jgi:hypothetical protein